MQNMLLLPDSHAALRDELMGALIGLARTAYSKPKDDSIDQTLIDALYLAGQSNSESELVACIRTLTAAKARIAPDCAACTSPCGATANYDMQLLRNTPKDILSVKLWVLYALIGMAVRLHAENSVPVPAFGDFLVPAISMLAEDLTAEELIPYAMKLMGSVL